VAVQEVQENVAVQKRVQVRRFHSRRRTATCRETFPRVLDAPKNERKSSAGEPRRKRSTARRTASAREIFSRRQSNASFLICSLGRSTMVRTTISWHVITRSQCNASTLRALPQPVDPSREDRSLRTQKFRSPVVPQWRRGGWRSELGPLNTRIDANLVGVHSCLGLLRFTGRAAV
jgi:hypothetical protein